MANDRHLEKDGTLSRTGDRSRAPGKPPGSLTTAATAPMIRARIIRRVNDAAPPNLG